MKVPDFYIDKGSTDLVTVDYPSSLDDEGNRQITLHAYEDADTFDLVFYSDEEGSQFVGLRRRDLKALKFLLENAGLMEWEDDPSGYGKG